MPYEIKPAPTAPIDPAPKRKAKLSDPIFTDPNAARAWLEARLWKDGPICPHCGVIDEATLIRGKSHRPGLYQCNACREPFTVTVGTIMERSKIPLNKWLCAIHLLMASKKGMSALQLGRMLSINKSTAWFMAHRIREGLRQGEFQRPLTGIVEADETYFGPVKEARTISSRGLKYKGKKTAHAKRVIISLVQRGGSVRSFHLPYASADIVSQIATANIAREARLFTDESRLYTRIGSHFAEHSTVNHSQEEYSRGGIHTNTIEGFFSIFKRGMKGVYQHCQEKHLHRYLAEFDFRYNHREGVGFDDTDRMESAIPGLVGKRLTYRRSNQARRPIPSGEVPPQAGKTS